MSRRCCGVVVDVTSFAGGMSNRWQTWFTLKWWCCRESRVIMASFGMEFEGVNHLWGLGWWFGDRGCVVVICGRWEYEIMIGEFGGGLLKGCWRRPICGGDVVSGERGWWSLTAEGRRDVESRFGGGRRGWWELIMKAGLWDGCGVWFIESRWCSAYTGGKWRDGEGEVKGFSTENRGRTVSGGGRKKLWVCFFYLMWRRMREITCEGNFYPSFPPFPFFRWERERIYECVSRREEKILSFLFVFPFFSFPMVPSFFGFF